MSRNTIKSLKNYVPIFDNSLHIHFMMGFQKCETNIKWVAPPVLFFGYFKKPLQNFNFLPILDILAQCRYKNSILVHKTKLKLLKHQFKFFGVFFVILHAFRLKFPKPILLTNKSSLTSRFFRSIEHCVADFLKGHSNRHHIRHS